MEALCLQTQQLSVRFLQLLGNHLSLIHQVQVLQDIVTADDFFLLNGRPASRVTEQPGTTHKRPDGPDHRMIRWIDLTWSVHHHSNTVQS